MTIAMTEEQIKPISIGSKVPDGELGTMDGQNTTLHAILNGKAAIIVFYRGSW